MPTQAPKDYFGARVNAPAPDASDEPNELLRLTQMRDRLVSLSNEARSIRAQVPREFEPDVERIQQQMHRLGERLSELSTGALHYGCGNGESNESAQAGSETVSDEVILLGGPRSDDPWDPDTANALTRFYESGASNESGGTEGAASSNAKGAPEAGRPVTTVEPAWLDRRFAEVAARIEQSLADIHPENSLLTIGQRFDQLEMHMASALRNVAMRTDIEELRVAEAQIEDIGAQLNQLRRQLGRLDTIDAQLTTLTAQLSDERLAKVFEHNESLARDSARLEAIDSQLASIAAQLSHDRLSDLVNESVSRGSNLEDLAESAARKAAAHFADQGLLEAQARDIGEVRGLIENLINERRYSDENNASMLDTMQQAIIRILDRVEALEVSGPTGGDATHAPKPAVSAPSPAPSSVSQAAAASMVPEVPHAEPPPTAVSLTAPSRTIDTGVEEPRLEETPSEVMPLDARYEPPLVAGMGASRNEEAFLPEEPTLDFETAPFSMDSAFAGSHQAAPSQPEATAPPRRMNVLRADFIADAHRAKLRAASKVEVGGEPDPARTSEGGAPMEKAAPLPAKSRARRSLFKSPRTMMSILTLLAMIPAALFFMPRTPVDGAADAERASSVFPADDGTSGIDAAAQGDATRDDPARATPVGPAAPAEDIGTQAPSDGMPSRRSQQVAPQDAYGRVDTASLPDGITMEPDAEPAAGRLVTRHKDGSVSEITGGPGVSAEDQSDARGPLAMPPALVGPFSLRLAATQGQPSAQYEVGRRLAEGKGLKQNLKQAVQWFQRSASGGFAMAQFRLGTLYERGVGVKSNLQRAKVWYSRAAEQGNVKAMHNLAVLIANGRGGSKPDYATARRWFTAAAERGLHDSQYNLAVLYENGMGVAKDEKEALKWFLLAATSGDAEATSRRDALKARLGDDDRADVEAAVASWRAKPVDPLANDTQLAGQAWRGHPQRPSTSG
jgi:localization factor PodJL